MGIAQNTRSLRRQQSRVARPVVVGHETICQDEEDRDRQTRAVDEGVEKEDVHDDRSYHHRSERNETAHDKGDAADEFGDLQQRKEVADGRESFVKCLNRAGHRGYWKKVEKKSNGGKKKQQPHQRADNDHCDFHSVLINP